MNLRCFIFEHVPVEVGRVYHKPALDNFKGMEDKVFHIMYGTTIIEYVCSRCKQKEWKNVAGNVTVVHRRSVKADGEG